MKKLNNLKWLAVLAIVLICSPWGNAQTKSSVEVYKLENGLTVILQEDHRRPEVQGFVTVRTGSVNESPDATGMAHYLEHVMFKGTQTMGTIDWEKEKPHYDKIVQLYDELGKTKDKKKREAIQKQINEESLKAAEYAVPNELSQLVDEMGGTGLNAATSYDYTYYLSKFPSSQIERWLMVYSHIFEKPVFRSFQAELETIYEEYNMYADQVYSRIQEEIMSNIFKKTPYGRDVIGLPDHLKNPSLTELQKFFATYYVPGNMGLVLVGDFDSNNAKQLIEKTFGKLEKKEAPAAINVGDEAPFKGRETLEIKMGYNNQLYLVFRTVPVRHDDDIALDICGMLLSNGQSGLLDQLLWENKVYSASAGNQALKNAGAFMISAVPNPQEFYEGPDPSRIVTYADYTAVVNATERAYLKAIPGTERMILAEIESLKEGYFEDWQLESIKQQLLTYYERQQENVSSKASALSNYFANDIPIEKYVNYVENIKKITREDIITIAKKYFNKDYLAIHLKPGKLKKTQIDKPEYKPLVFPNAEAQSIFGKEFSAVQTPEQKIKFIDFSADLQKIAMKNGNTIHYTKNPVNDVFSLTIRYDVGSSTIKELDYTYLLNYAGAAAREAKALKGQFARLNCSYSISADKNFLYVSMSGPEVNLQQAVTYLNLLINQMNLPSNQMNRLYLGEKGSREYEREEVDAVADALSDYVMYGKESDYIDRWTLKTLMSMKSTELLSAFKNATEYSATIFYTGAKSANEIKTMLEQNMKFADAPKKGKGYQERARQPIKENVVYFVNHPSLQAQIYFLADGKAYQIKDAPVISAYNNYFGGGFTGLLMQEIREYRSMAYGAGGGYSTPGLPEKPALFYGVIQTQNDKAANAIDVYMDLVRNMPVKANRMDVLKKKLELSAATTRPDFRSIPMTLDYWERMGYTEDPVKFQLSTTETMTFDDIVNFEKTHIKDQPMAIMIVGDKKRIDMKALAKYGKVIELKPYEIFSKLDE